MTVLVYILLVLLALKCVYNLTIPYTLLGKMSKNDEGGISFMPYVDVVLFVMAVALSFPADGASFVSDPKKVALYSLGAVVVSYLHLVLVMMVGGWILTRRKEE